MLGYVQIVALIFLFFLFSMIARGGLQRQNCSWQNSAQATVTLRGVRRLCAVFYTFGSVENRNC